MKTSAVIFADGTREMRDAGVRLHGQIENLNIFDDVSLYDKNRLISESVRFKSDFSKITKLDKYPLYFRAIKPWLVFHQMYEKGQEFDLVLYIDAGCEVTNNCVSRLSLKILLKKAYMSGGLAEETPYSEKEFTKVSLLKLFKDSNHLFSRGHIQDTWFILRRNETNRELLLKWMELSDPNLNLWQDPLPEDLANQSFEFRAHRHDQSIFSILYKENNLMTKKISSEYHGRLGTLRGISIPIHGLRNRSGDSLLKIYHSNNLLSFLSFSINQVAKILRKIIDQIP